ncbi:MAG: DUF1778 domain-containing protein [Candidatus Omnitrophica bacterium]|nr:DUF1778 domain-containing protein [Candidatus Omnitrophota bacterium]MCA9433010.1 DUF1778 domain-containing protein [Candidatus Omnitrophota bacterium]MCA9439614.1 DUF1778 domain-containing protein [Candidatus Omnitrophota bacterium]MCB9766729.1 DUF1778 domain-containing protein [Candidatus Omnitrophota bacterium]
MKTAETKKPSVSRELKKERMELRLTASRKAIIQQAMALSGQTAGDLAYEGARQVLEQHERMVLRGADKDVFLDAILNPRKPRKKLVDALKLHQEKFG